MNEVIALLQGHRSIRKFTPTPVTAEQKAAVIRSAQMASTSSNVQAYTIIGVSDPCKKQELATLAGNQKYVEECPWFLVFCADLHRNRVACELQGTEMVAGTMENFLVATVDAALAAQNAAVAAESLGLGIVYIGGIRNHPREVSQLLRLPELVYPVFGMCIGVPDQEPDTRPRLAMEAVYQEEAYQPEGLRAAIEAYDDVTRTYYLERTGGTRDITWSQGIADKYRHPLRAHMRAFLEEQGFRFD